MDHDENTTRAFSAFGAKPPPCLGLVTFMRGAENAYHKVVGTWTGPREDNFVGSNRINLRGLAPDEVAERIKKAHATEKQRVAKAQRIYRWWRTRWESLKRLYGMLDFRARRAEVRMDTAKLALRDEHSLVTDLWKALDAVETEEQAAALAQEAASAARRRFLEGEFMAAAELAKSARDTEQEYYRDPQWARYYETLNGLAIATIAQGWRVE
jgi:hypothetical protein